MKLLYILFLVPTFVFAQLSAEDQAQLQLIDSNTETLSTEAYNEAIVISDLLLTKHPKDSTVLISRVRLYDAYVRKSKCTAYLVPKDDKLCAKALKFYDETTTKINTSRITLAQGRAYYNMAMHNEQPEAKIKAKSYFNKAIESGEFSDYEVAAINRYLIQL